MKKATLLYHFFAFTLFIGFQLLSNNSFAQCGINTPTFTVDLSSNSDSAWISPDAVRMDTCCGSTGNCIAFILTLAPDAQGILFDVCDGALPPGALFYQVACGPQTPVGNVLCLNGAGPHYITFCKPGNNTNKYCITSIGKPKAGPSIAVNDGCVDTISASGYDTTTIQWTSIFPGPIGAYDTLLSCDTCATSLVVGGNNYPPFIDYQVCGTPIGACGAVQVCDTLRVSFYNTMNVQIQPSNPTVCFGATNTWIKAVGSGGNPPYNFNWSNGSTLDSIQVGVGTYIVEMNDGSNCPSAFDTVTVTAFANTIEALAGNDSNICIENLPINLNGAVIAAGGGRWSNGGGTYTPNDSTLNATYIPSPSEIFNGFVELILTTTGNGSCPLDKDTVRYTFVNFSATINAQAYPVSCFGSSDGAAKISTTGVNTPYSFLWDAAAGNSTSDSVSNLAIGRYRFTVSNVFGCTDTGSVLITQPQALVASTALVNNVSCFGGSDGQVIANASGGTSPYTFTWPSGTVNSVDTSLSTGTYVVTVNDARGCTDTASITVTEPAQLIASISTFTPVSCYGGSNGTATAAGSGGTPPYSYLWPSGGNTNLETGLNAGTHIVTVSDNLGCSDTVSVTILQPDSLIANSTELQPVSCNGLNDGIASASASGGVSPYTYSWPSGSTFSNDSNLFTGTYVVTISDNNSCTATDTVIITEPSPLIASISNSSNVLCFGGNDGSLTASVIGGTSPYFYQWPSGTIIATESNLIAGRYTVTITDSRGCTDSISGLITEPNPLDLSLVLNPVSCNGGADGSATINPIGGTPAYTFFWSDGSSNNSFNNLSAGTYSISLTDFNGCTIDSTFSIIEPQPLLVTVSDNDTVCLNTPADISASASGGNGNYTFNWSQGIGFGANKQVNPLQSTTYVVSTTDAKGCQAPLDSVRIFIRDIGSDSIRLFSGGDICVGQSSTVRATHNGTLGPYTYQWRTLGPGLGPKTVFPNTSTYYVFTATDACGVSRTDSILVGVENYPVVTLPNVIENGCAPLRVFFEDSLNANPNNYVYSWNFGDGSTSNIRTTNHLYSNPGTYQVQLTATTPGGCSSSSSQGGSVIVRPSPTADFYADPFETTLANPQINYVNTSVGANSYLWVFGNDSSRAFDTSIVYSDTVSLAVKLIVRNNFGCYDSIVKLIKVTPSFEFKLPNAFTPNPNGPNGGRYNINGLSNDVFFIFAEYVKDFNMLIFNRWGEVIFESDDINIGWDGYYKGEICQQDVYVYKIRITWADGSISNKVGDVTLFR